MVAEDKSFVTHICFFDRVDNKAIGIVVEEWFIEIIIRMLILFCMIVKSFLGGIYNCSFLLH